jgi:hypothetical protein
LFKFARRHRVMSAATLGLGSLVLIVVLGFATVSLNPGLAAQGAEVLRHVIGEENVARLETWVLGWQDTFQSWAYRAEGDQPQAPWPTATPALATESPATPAFAGALTPAAVTAEASLSQLPTPLPTVTPLPDAPRPSPTVPPANLPAPLKPMGHVDGEGVWSIYLRNPAGEPVAFRTFLQPDPQRVYAVAAVVAMDLTATRLHWVLGSQEPASPETLHRTGRIPTSDLKSGLLLAAFNGGFKAEHGLFGAMTNGAVVLAPRAGFGTVAMYDDGHVAIGAWGTDVFWAKGLRNWRQNGPLIVQGGQINPHTADASPEDWGYTVKGDTATWRSGLGISADGNTLYYLGGPYLTLPVLAQAMADSGAANGIQLDINGYWVMFDAIQAMDGGLQAVPVMDGMKNDGRYLRTFDRDFFYLTATAN